MILNIAHRGYSSKFDENTMKAFENAIKYGADGIETDVQLTKDNIPVLIHDETLDRTTNGSGFIKDYTFEELRKFKTTNFERIPTLEELLILFKNSNLKVLNLELKNSIVEYRYLEQKVLELIKKYELKDRIIISSFNHYSLIKVRELDENIVLGVLTESTLVDVPSYLRKLKVQCYHPHYASILNKERLKELKDNNIIVNPYTINNKNDMLKAIELGVDAIITNEVEVLKDLLKYRCN